MKTNLLIGIFTFCIGQVFAQGNWNAPTVNNWKYDMKGAYAVPPQPWGECNAYASYPGTEEIIKSGSDCGAIPAMIADNTGDNLVWLPTTESGKARLAMSNNVNSNEQLSGIYTNTDGSKRFAMPLHQSGVGKFSLYDIPEAEIAVANMPSSWNCRPLL